MDLCSREAVPNLFGTRGWFCGRKFFHGQGRGVCIRGDSSALHLLCTLFLLLLHQLHFRASDITYLLQSIWGFPHGTSGKEPSCQWRRPKRHRLDRLEEGLATHSRILAWKIPWTEEPGGLWCIGLHRIRHYWSDLALALLTGCGCGCFVGIWPVRGGDRNLRRLIQLWTAQTPDHNARHRALIQSPLLPSWIERPAQFLNLVPELRYQSLEQKERWSERRGARPTHATYCKQEKLWISAKGKERERERKVRLDFITQILILLSCSC